MIHKRMRNRLFFFIRLALILSILINLFISIMRVIEDKSVTHVEIIGELSKRIELVFWAVLTLILSFASDFIERKKKIDIPDVLEMIIVLFIYAGLFLSARFNLYYRFFWWDDLLHMLSGVIIGFIGFIMIYTINHKYSMDLSPVLVALFSFTFAVTLGVIWEILEFTADVLFGTANQKWDLPDTAILIGKPYQGSGLRDTMSDLIVDSIGAFITSLITYWMYKNQKKKTLDELEKMMHPDTN